jgi:hypothetical protein
MTSFSNLIVFSLYRDKNKRIVKSRIVKAVEHKPIFRSSEVSQECNYLLRVTKIIIFGKELQRKNLLSLAL